MLQLLVRDDIFSKLILEHDEVCDIVPEVREMIGFDQSNPHHPYDVWVHTAHSVASAQPDPMLRLALLMHDIGKPVTFYRTEDAVGHFNRHEAEGERIVRNRLPELGFNEETVETIAVLVRNHDKKISASDLDQSIAEFGIARLNMLLDLKEADSRSHDAKYKISQIANIEELRRIMGG